MAAKYALEISIYFDEDELDDIFILDVCEDHKEMFVSIHAQVMMRYDAAKRNKIKQYDVVVYKHRSILNTKNGNVMVLEKENEYKFLIK